MKRYIILIISILCFFYSPELKGQFGHGAADMRKTEAILDSLNSTINKMNELTKVNKEASVQIVALTKINQKSSEQMRSLTIQMRSLTLVILFFTGIQLLLAFFDKNQLIQAKKKFLQKLKKIWDKRIIHILHKDSEKPSDDSD